MTKKNFSIFSIILFVLAGLLVVYSGWAFISCRNYISEAMASGQLVTSGNEYEIVNFYMSNVAQYMLFAVLFIAVGWLLRKPSPSPIVSEVPVESASPAPREKDDDNVDEWIEEMQQDEGDKNKDKA